MEVSHTLTNCVSILNPAILEDLGFNSPNSRSQGGSDRYNSMQNFLLS
jgi:hypothetical protein